MLTIYRADSNNQLLALYFTHYQSKTIQSVFDKRYFLVPNVGIQQWLTQQFANQYTLLANYQFLSTTAFFNFCSDQLNRYSNRTEQNSIWIIEALLREMVNEPQFIPIHHYLQGESIAIKRYQLARHLQQLFRDYYQWSPQFFQAWQQNQLITDSIHELWQRAIWQQLSQHPIKSEFSQNNWQLAIDLLTQNCAEIGYSFPKSIVIFGVDYFSTLEWDFLQTLANYIQIEIYQWSPIKNNQLINTDDCHFLTIPETVSVIENSNYSNHQTHSLAKLQSYLFQKQDFSIAKNNKIDRSIQIHACHSRLREIQVLKDQLLATIEKDKTLQWRDIVVLSVDINQYQGLIQAVFHDIPIQVISNNHSELSIASAFIQFLQVCDSRFGWQSVLDLLSHPIIYPNFDLTETDLIYLKQWLTETEIRWGKSAAHKQQLGLPAFHENTWQHSIERLLMGYAIAEDQLFIDNILPYKNLEGSSTQALGGLIDFIELLFRASEELTIAQSLYSWQQKLTEYANLLFSTIEIEQRLSFIQQLTELTQSFVTELSNLIELSVIITVLNEYFNSGSKIHSLLRGSLTFSHLSTLQGVPFKVVAILGLNESEFPRLNKDSTIDLATNYRPKISQLDRLHFLQWIVNTEQQFILSYIGQSLAKQRKIPPSILLSELIEIVQYKIGIAYDDLVIYHPLQPFHSNYFNQENSALFSYSTYYAAIAIGFSQLNKPVIEPWWQGELAIEKPNLILLTDLLAFYRHPQRYFLKKQLDLSLKPLATPIEEREIFSLSGLSLYDLQHQWIEAKLSGNTFSLAQLVASGQWILGTVGELTFDIQQKKLADFVKIIEELAIGNALPQRLIDLSFQNYRLLGKLTHLYQQGSLFYRYSSLKGKDFFQALLHHLIINQLQSQTTYLLTKEQLIIFKPEIISTELFAELLDEYCQGQQRPDILFPEFVLAYIQQARQLINNPKIQKSAYAAAQQAWITQFNSDYEIELQQLYLGFESIAEQNREKWVQICEQWFLPLWLQLTIIPIESLV